MGVDEHPFRSLPGFPATGHLSGILRRLLRRRSLRHEGGLTGDGAGAAAADVQQLVPRTLSVRLRDVPLRQGYRVTPTTLSTPAVAPPESARVFVEEVRHFLTQQPRQLPSRYLYDDVGSALFEAICRLPSYPLTRAELRLLARHAREILDAGVTTIVELGPGSGAKLSALIAGAGGHRGRLDLHLVDVSASALAQARRALETHPAVRVVTHRATYE